LIVIGQIEIRNHKVIWDEREGYLTETLINKSGRVLTIKHHLHTELY